GVDPAGTTSENPTVSPPTPSKHEKQRVQKPARGQPTGWGPTLAEWRHAQSVAGRMTDAELAGQVIVARYTGTSAPTDLIARYHLGGVIVMSENISSVGSLVASNQELAAAAGSRPWPLVVAVDQEGGIVARVGAPMTQFPTFMSLGAAHDPRLAEHVSRASGQELRAAGFTMVFAPDADVTIGPADPTIGSRSAGSDPRAVGRLVSASTRGYSEAGIVSVLKHFPGHGSVTANSHEALPHQQATVDELTARDFVPFAAAMKVGAPAVMVAHISLDRVDPGMPADLSRADIQLLTSGLGFDGLLSTDALEMAAVTDEFSSGGAAVAALKAGDDLLLMPLDLDGAYQGILSALRDDSLPRQRVEEAAAKIGALMLHEQHHRAGPASALGSHQALSRRESAKAITVVAGACAGPYVDGSVQAVGDPADVGLFTAAARRAGLEVGAGTTIGLADTAIPEGDLDVAVSVDTPYVLAGSVAPTRLAVFGRTPGAMAALVDVLTGDATVTGRLPVDVAGVDVPHC
ncbi:MAG: glycoside hydrolase family 3 protein, partial [Nocardioidaceae bacterium]